jgi:hypothetical protein
MEKMSINCTGHFDESPIQDKWLDKEEVDPSRQRFVGDLDLPERAYATHFSLSS